MSNVSRAVIDRLRISRVVMRAIEIRGEDVAKNVEGILFPDGAPATLTTAAMIQALHDALERADQTLEKADIAHASELADDQGFRDARDQAERNLHELLQRTRALLIGAYDTTAVGKVGLADALPRGGQDLIQCARHAASLISVETLGEPTDDLVPIDPAALAARIAAGADAFDRALDDVEREKREAQETLEARDAATEEWGRIYGGVADAFTAFAALAGYEDLAEKVKPTPRRRAGRPETIDVAVVLEDKVALPEPGPGEGGGE